MEKLFLVCVIGCILTLSACRKDEINPSLLTKPVEQTKTEQLKVDSEFNWKTFKDIQLTLTGTSNGILSVVSVNQTIYQKIFLTKDQPYVMKLTVPTYETSVRLLYMGKDVNINLTSNEISYKFI